MHTTLDALRDAIADAIVEAPRHFDDTCHVCAADAVFATPEMEAIRQALQTLHAAGGDNYLAVGLDLPQSVIDWVLAPALR